MRWTCHVLGIPGGCREYPLRCVTLVLIFLLVMPLAACSRLGSRPTPVIPPPSVAITSPTSGQTVQADEDVPINSTANDTQGILKVELWVDGQLYRVDPSSDPEGQRTFVASQLWSASPPGSHTMVVKAYSRSGQVAESLPVVVSVVPSVASVRTDTPTFAPPTDTPTLAADTPSPPTDTPVPLTPTDTSVPPQPTDTLPPTDTPVPEDASPVVQVLVPQGDVTLNEGVDLTIRVRATDDRGVARVELWADGALHKTYEPGAMTPVEVDLTWRASGLGEHTLEVKAFDTASQASQAVALKAEVTAELPPMAEPFAHVWALGGVGERLGDPAAEGVLDRWVADQFFEGGLAYWRNNESSSANYVYVLLYEGGADETQGTAWLHFEDLWREGAPEFSCPQAEANGDLGPKRGFGKVWCEQAAVRDGLGSPLVVEQGANAGFQDFENGTMLWLARLGYVYVLYHDGDWQRFSDQP
jgi:hypothetical protein